MAKVTFSSGQRIGLLVLFNLFTAVYMETSVLSYAIPLEKYFFRLFFYPASLVVFLALYLLSMLDPGIVRTAATPLSTNKCETCGVEKLPEKDVAHCKSCEHCVEGYDHHSYFINKCIGSGNRIAYLLLVLAGGIALDACFIGISAVLYRLWMYQEEYSITYWMYVTMQGLFIMIFARLGIRLTMSGFFHLLTIPCGITSTKFVKFVHHLFQGLENANSAGITCFGYSLVKVLRIAVFLPVPLLTIVYSTFRAVISESPKDYLPWILIIITTFMMIGFLPLLILDNKMGTYKYVLDEEDEAITRSCDCDPIPQSRLPSHCPVCNKCVAGRDQHNPFLGVCIGYHNRLLYCAFLCASFAATSLFCVEMFGSRAALWDYSFSPVPYVTGIAERWYEPAFWLWPLQELGQKILGTPVWVWLHALVSLGAVQLVFISGVFIAQQVVFVLYSNTKGSSCKSCFPIFYGPEERNVLPWVSRMKKSAD